MRLERTVRNSGALLSTLIGILSLLMFSACREDVARRKQDRVLGEGCWLPPAPATTPTTSPSPPDLAGCTRLEIQYDPSVVDYFFGDDLEGLLNPAELMYVRALDKIDVRDIETIGALAAELKQGSSAPPREGPFTFRGLVRFTCYEGSRRQTAFTCFPDVVVTEEGHRFKYAKELRGRSYRPPELEPFLLRAECASRLKSLCSALQLFYWDKGALPLPGQWCDAIVAVKKESDHLDEAEILNCFVCPSGGRDRCDYAMNPHCEPNSPPDTVLLFEANAGWNQHGGSELFTFDNHDPRGGFVVLNNCDWDSPCSPTVRFVRTEEELEQLRWR